ncbi:MAG: TAT (twin-arginine translocation) pathway signal sequence [Phascolarctobacterium sp.]|nr:MAG: TAT (twin-arginine translocation) pathway signal sequence [Phascolarctobacterium sp.]
MTNLNDKISRRKFLQMTAGAAIGAAMLNMPGMSFAAGAKVKAAAYNDLPDAVKLAANSELVQLSYQKIKDTVNTIQNPTLKRMTMDVINNPVPTFMNNYQLPGSKRAVYNKLAAAGLIDTSKTSLENFLPPYNGGLPQPFYSAPGSGYASHHAYPGGLATHTAANLQISEGIYNTYTGLFKSDISHDIVISAQALHDLAKPLVFQWQKDQASLPEYQIAGTGAHHIFSIAEVIYRGFPVEEVVAQSCAHTIPTGKDELTVVGYLKAAAIIAGKDAEKLGLVTSKDTIPTPHKQEGYITSLGDHDFVLSGPACQKSVAILKEIAAKDYGMSKAELEGEHFNRFRNYIGAQYSMMYIDSLASTKNGMERIRQAVKAAIIK